jgi:hypothetical protein
MSKGVESILITRQEIIFLPRTKLFVVEGVHVVIKVRYSELKLNQHSGRIVKGVPRDWSKVIHSTDTKGICRSIQTKK